MSCPDEIMESFEEFRFLLFSTTSAFVITEVTGFNSTWIGVGYLIDFDVLLVTLATSLSFKSDQVFGKLLHLLRSVKRLKLVLVSFGFCVLHGSENLLVTL